MHIAGSHVHIEGSYHQSLAATSYTKMADEQLATRSNRAIYVSLINVLQSPNAVQMADCVERSLLLGKHSGYQ